jgi:hypothetical protein
MRYLLRLAFAGLLMLWLVAPSAAQPESTEPAAAEAEEPLPSSALETINRILEEDQASADDEELGYDPGDRRDPFRSLLVREARPDARGPRPDGIPGLLIDDLTLTGVFVTAAGPVAQVTSSSATTAFLLHEGDRLFDGEVVRIRLEKNGVAEIAFRQGVEDPAAIRSFREVVKELSQ